MANRRIQELTNSWDSDERWTGITRPYRQKM